VVELIHLTSSHGSSGPFWRYYLVAIQTHPEIQLQYFLLPYDFFLEPKQKRALKVYCCTYVQ
jgi:hypothetical protein